MKNPVFVILLIIATVATCALLLGTLYYSVQLGRYINASVAALGAILCICYSFSYYKDLRKILNDKNGVDK
jgi:uncharacterized membrane protein YccC